MFLKLLVCGDVHLTNYSNFNRPTDNSASGSRLEKILEALDYFFQYGNDHDIHTFIINGDLFDQRQRENPSTMAYIRNRILDAYHKVDTDKNILYLNVGNHDEQSQAITPNALQDFWRYTTNSHFIQVMQDVTLITDYDHEYLFVPYSEDVQYLKDKINQTLKEDPETYPITVFAHLGVEGGVQGRWDHRLSGAFNVADLGWNDHRVKAIILGHYHNRSTVKQSKNKEAWYVGDLTELNFNDIGKDGYGAPRGFDVVDPVKGTHEFVDLTKDPYNISTFNSFDLDQDKIDSDKLVKLAQNNYVRLVTSDQDNYEMLKSILPSDNVQLVLNKQDTHEQLDVDPNSTDVDLVKEYCEKHYPEVTDQALEYLRKAKEN